MTIARVQARGQVTVPQDVRHACGIDAGTDLYFVVIGSGRFECVVLPPARSVLEIAQEYAGEGSAPDIDALRQGMGEEIARERLGPIGSPSPA
jgi:bifunctional DNA-binding transcriptional regulator/antitoxin component of YhaV-PrlF toxin-antitoxin module